jgi:hypothetical protein
MYLRLGLTETTLFFYYWLENNRHADASIINEIHSSKHNMINWLYTTSGFYDKSIQGTYFNINSTAALLSSIYNTYMTNLLEIIKNTELTLCFHNVSAPVQPYKQEFLTYISSITKQTYSHNISRQDVFARISNKRLLIVNPMSSLMKQQYDTGNVQKLYPTFPSLTSIQIYENPYTFFNNGPDSSILETAKKVSKEIQTKDFDIAIVSCGAYSSLIGHHIRTVMGKDVITLGGDLLSIFGIKTGRSKNGPMNEHWISVPDHLKPIDYMKIENGCYW